MFPFFYPEQGRVYPFFFLSEIWSSMMKKICQLAKFQKKWICHHFFFLSHKNDQFLKYLFLIFKIKTGASVSSVRQPALDFSTGYDPVFWDRAPQWAPHSVGSLPEDSLSHFAPPYHQYAHTHSLYLSQKYINKSLK